MAETTVWMVSGNKGGVGKSLFCLALASALELRRESYAVFDGDGRTGDVFTAFHRKVPARWGDFRDLRPESHHCTLDEVYERTIHQLLKSSSHLIINSPDGADRILAKWFDVTLRHTETHNRHFKFIYMMSDRADGLDMLPQLTSRFLFMYPIRNLYFGKPESFSAFNAHYRDQFHEVIDMPALRAQEARLLFDRSMHPFEAMTSIKDATGTYQIHSLSRVRIMRWLFAFAEAIDNVIANDAMPNIKMSADTLR